MKKTNIIRLYRQYTPIAILGVIVLSMVLLLVYLFYLQSDAITKKEAISSEVTELKKRVDIIEYNKNLTKNQIIELNKVLSLLIPDTEDFFSIIRALDKISRETGFTITDYTLSPKSPSGKLSLAVEGVGNLDDFMKFLQQYRFIGERLITIEKMNFSESNFSSTKLQLNFYSDPFVSNNVPPKKISDEDLQLLQKIHTNITFTKERESEDYETYETKSNPFGSE